MKSVGRSRLLICWALVLSAMFGWVARPSCGQVVEGQLTEATAKVVMPAAVGEMVPRQVEAIDGQPLLLGVGAPFRFQVVCFLGTECPLAKLYGPRLDRLADELTERRVQFVGVFSNRQDSLAEINAYVAKHELTFPVIHDAGNRLADWLSATRTPEVVVLDALGKVRYRGRIDDQYEPGIVRTEPTEHDLKDAISALLDDRQPPRQRTQAVGCIIGREPSSEQTTTLTFNRDIAPILNRHCVSCHRPDQIGPFALVDYDEVVGWGEMMLEVIDQGRMPPWHAAPPHDRFQGSRVMSSEEVETLRQWVAGGMPEGDREDLPEPPQFVDGWSLPREPDEIIPMSQQPMKIPASGVVEYQYFVVDPGWQEDRWVRAAEVIPGNPAVVHHVICFVRPPDGSSFRGVGWLTGYVPGQRPAVLPDGHARLIPAGSKLVFQMHYTPTGKPETDVSQVGVIFADKAEVTHEVLTWVAINQSFEIPAGAEQHPVQGVRGGFREGDRLLSLMPHMHYRGSAFEVDLFAPGEDPGRESGERLLEVPHYDFNWQHDYRFEVPIELQPGQQLQFTAYFDNSTHNPWNPDPSVPVTWGDQSWEEMAVAFFDIARRRDREVDLAYSPAPPSDDFPQGNERAERFVAQFFERFDANKDGLVQRDETPTSFASFGFWRMDTNGDRVLDTAEIYQAAHNKFAR